MVNVSIIVPVYNGESRISGCIEALLDQNYQKERYEIIIVDNNSKDRTAEIIRNYPVKYILEDKIQNSYASRNTGVRSSKGKIIAFTDDDCIVDRNWLKEGVESLMENSVGCVAGTIKAYKPKNYIEEYLSERNIISQQGIPKELPFPYAKTANAFYRREVFESIGLFEEKWVSGGDADLSWRMLTETGYKIKFITDAIVLHKHRTSLKTMFKQCVKWGVGYNLLSRKYKNKMAKRNFKQNIWIILRVFYVFIALIPFYFSNKKKMKKGKRKQYLDYITFTGWEIGKIIGFLKNRA